MIIDLLKFTIKEEYAADAVKLMEKQMKNNLGDEGCLMSNTFRSKTNSNELYLMLAWENQDSIDKHLATDHDREFREALDPMLAAPPDFLEDIRAE